MIDHIEQLKQDEVLSELIEKHGQLDLFYSSNPFQQLVMMIVEQQVSTESARAVQSRLFDKFEVSPENIRELGDDELKSVGLSRQKTEYIKNVSEFFVKDEPDWQSMSDQEVVDQLTDIKGIGNWTAEMFLIFGLGRKDVFSTGDLGLRRAMENLYGIKERKEMKEKADKWKPHRSIASLYLWKWHD